MLGQEHPDVATSLNDLAALYHAQGRYGEAEPLHTRSLAIYEKALLEVAISGAEIVSQQPPVNPVQAPARPSWSAPNEPDSRPR